MSIRPLQDSDDPKKNRTKIATLVKVRHRQEKDATYLRDNKWVVLSPYWDPGSDGQPVPNWTLTRGEVITPEQIKQVIADQYAAAEELRRFGWTVTAPYID